MFLWLGMLPLVRTEELHWGIMSVFLRPMPLTHSSVLNSLHLMLHYNCLFSMLLQLKGLLCFQMIQNIVFGYIY